MTDQSAWTTRRSAGLTETQLTHIRRLEEVCNQFEGLTMKLNWNTLQQRPTDQVNDFFCYAGDDVVGYLALYNFNRQEAEVSAMTHPDYRRRGIFKQLLSQARLELEKRGTPDFLFICEQASASGKQTMQASGGIYEFSEYKMVLQEALKPARAGAEVDLRPAQPEDLEVIARLNEICFGLPVESTRAWLENRLVNSNRQIMVAWVAGKRIGKIEILRAKTETSISAFCLFSEYRGQGYGTTILSRTVEQLVAEGCPQISLEVAVDNKHALLLYERCGFETETAYDYYRLPVGD